MRAQPAVRLALIGALFAATRPSLGQAPRTGVIDGLVTDSTLSPIDGADVAIFRTSVHVETGGSGRFRIHQVPAGQYLIIVRRLGFRPVSGIVDVAPDETVRLSYTMEHSIARLDATVVTEKNISVKMVEFEARRREGAGQFLTQEDIQRHGAVYPTELIRSFSGIRVISTSGGGGSVSYVAVGSRGGMGDFVMSDSGSRNPPCLTQIFVDGARIAAGTNLDLLPPPKDIAGVELYTGPARVPPQYIGRGLQCGVMLIWTKDRP
jgi:hypothetical protein